MAALIGTTEADFKLPGGVAGRRRLAAFLSKAGEEQITVNGIHLSKQEALAHLMWNLLITGEIVFPDGRLLFVEEVEQWVSVAKFVFTHLDGPAVGLADSRAGNAVVRVVFGNEPAYPDGEPISG